jgi:hypothetical protein
LGFVYKQLKKQSQTTGMQNSSSSQHYGCSTNQEIPSCLLENLKGDDKYKTLHIKM